MILKLIQNLIYTSRLRRRTSIAKCLSLFAVGDGSYTTLRKNIHLLVLLCSLNLNLFGATKSDLASQFDASRAFDHVKKQVEFGPRPSGSAELQKTREYLRAQLESYGLEVVEQSFEQKTSRGNILFSNVIARRPITGISRFLRSKPKLILGSHYDTKWLPNFRFVGANDAGSSTGVLLEIARVVGQRKFHLANAAIEFVFFDGEEAFESYTATDGLYGSRYYVQQIKKKEDIQAMILMDMIGDKDLSVQIPQGDAGLTKKVFNAAELLGYRDRYHLMNRPITDDHVPFLEAGIPAIDLIDFEFGSHNHYWHTGEDTLDKVSPESLKIVGQTVLKLLETYDSR